MVDLTVKCTNRKYVYASVFAQDFSDVISKGIKEGIPQQDGSPSANPANDVKVTRALAKRIIKAIQDKLEAAVRAEAVVDKKHQDLTENMVNKLKARLEECLDPRPDPASGDPVVVDAVKSAESTFEFGNKEQAKPVFQSTANKSSDTPPDSHGEGEAVADVDADADADGDADDTIAVHDPMDVDQDEDAPHETEDLDDKNAETAGSNGYASIAEHHQPPPPTPPTSHGGSLASGGQEGTIEVSPSHAEGGVPWYIKPFDPIGTTVLDNNDNKWAGREAAQSEELSEIDDDELNNMSAVMDGMESVKGLVKDGAAEKAAEAVSATPKKNKSKKRKRNW